MLIANKCPKIPQARGKPKMTKRSTQKAKGEGLARYFKPGVLQRGLKIIAESNPALVRAAKVEMKLASGKAKAVEEQLHDLGGDILRTKELAKAARMAAASDGGDDALEDFGAPIATLLDVVLDGLRDIFEKVQDLEQETKIRARPPAVAA
jgi:hypothetical protein